MAYGIRLEVWGNYALFTRPELKVERYSYSVITPSAARGILESLYWHPGMRWIVDRIYVLEKIQFENIRRNEVKSKISARNISTFASKPQGELYLSTREEIQQRASTVLKNPHYIIEAHFEMTDKASQMDNAGKFCEIFRRRARKGQCYHMPYFGCREMPAYFRLYEEEAISTAYPGESQDLGFMLYDMDYRDKKSIQPIFFHAKLADGILDLRDCEVYR